MGDTPSVSVHVRRGDYVEDPATKAWHGGCGQDYYEQAVAHVRAYEPGRELHAFVFSDDPSWVRANLDLGCPTTVIDHNGPAAHEDLRLMTCCRHHIVANSTFSWWGAWLGSGSDEGGCVVAPRRWFNQDDVDTSTLVPSGWARL